MIDLRTINKRQFTIAKLYWSAAIVTKLVIFGVGVWAVFIAPPPLYLPQILLGLAIISELLQLRSDGIKGQAESLLRTLDMCKSFGLEVSKADQRDIVANVPRTLRKRFSGNQTTDSYFASTQADGPEKAIENLLESAWYTRHLAGTMAVLYILLIIGLLAVSVFTLLFALQQINNTLLREQIARVVTAWLLLIVSLGMLKSAWSYYKMYQRCHKTEMSCKFLLQSSVSEADALKQWYEYQMARASAPLLPQWLWLIRGSSLDDAWQRATGKMP